MLTSLKKKKRKLSGQISKNALVGSRFMIFAARTCSIAMTKRFDSHSTFSFKDKSHTPLNVDIEEFFLLVSVRSSEIKKRNRFDNEI